MANALTWMALAPMAIYPVVFQIQAQAKRAIRAQQAREQLRQAWIDGWFCLWAMACIDECLSACEAPNAATWLSEEEWTTLFFFLDSVRMDRRFHKTVRDHAEALHARLLTYVNKELRVR